VQELTLRKILEDRRLTRALFLDIEKFKIFMQQSELPEKHVEWTEHLFRINTLLDKAANGGVVTRDELEELRISGDEHKRIYAEPHLSNLQFVARKGILLNDEGKDGTQYANDIMDKLHDLKAPLVYVNESDKLIGMIEPYIGNAERVKQLQPGSTDLPKL